MYPTYYRRPTAHIGILSLLQLLVIIAICCGSNIVFAVSWKSGILGHSQTSITGPQQQQQCRGKNALRRRTGFTRAAPLPLWSLSAPPPYLGVYREENAISSKKGGKARNIATSAFPADDVSNIDSSMAAKEAIGGGGGNLYHLAEGAALLGSSSTPAAASVASSSSGSWGQLMASILSYSIYVKERLSPRQRPLGNKEVSSFEPSSSWSLNNGGGHLLQNQKVLPNIKSITKVTPRSVPATPTRPPRRPGSSFPTFSPGDTWSNDEDDESAFSSEEEADEFDGDARSWPTLRPLIPFPDPNPIDVIPPHDNVKLFSHSLECRNDTTSCSAPARHLNRCCVPTNGNLVFVQSWLPGQCRAAKPPLTSSLQQKVCSHQAEQVQHWTIHGLWPTTCAGQWVSDCDRKRQARHTSSLLTPDLRAEMANYWVGRHGNSARLWTHEWNKHGTCWSPSEPQCFVPGGLLNQGQDFIKFFSFVLNVRAKYDLTKILGAVGIYPGSAFQSDRPLQRAVQMTFPGLKALFLCQRGYLTEVRMYLRATQDSAIPNPTPVHAHTPQECGETPFIY